uniref:Uncharacterized protein n=1 Tax=Panagrolaimus sp. ES5 TaxID=591445 RepID=A0AC34FL21_9BILA
MADILFRKGIHLPLWNGQKLVDVDNEHFPKMQNPFGTTENVLPFSIFESVIDALLLGRKAFLACERDTTEAKREVIGHPHKGSFDLVGTGLEASVAATASKSSMDKKRAVYNLYKCIKSVIEW